MTDYFPISWLNSLFSTFFLKHPVTRGQYPGTDLNIKTNKNKKKPLKPMRPRTWVCYRHWTQSVQTHLLLLRLMTLSLCISPISSGSDSSLLECRKSTDACFQFPIWDERRARSQTLETNSSHCLSTLEQTDRQVGNDVHTDLWRKLSKEVVISSKRAHGNAQAHRGRQGFNLIETAVQLFQICQANRANNNRGKMGKKRKTYSQWVSTNLLWNSVVAYTFRVWKFQNWASMI